MIKAFFFVLETTEKLQWIVDKDEIFATIVDKGLKEFVIRWKIAFVQID